MKLKGYWRSSAAYRVRIALNLKGLSYEQESVHLVKDGGQQHQSSFRELNPAGLVPVLEVDGMALNQSLAIMDYLENAYPDVKLLPVNAKERAAVMAMTLDIACDIHPLNNLRILQYLSNELSVEDEQKKAWIHHWVDTGFAALEYRLGDTAGEYCFGNQVTWADINLVPQVYNAIRFGVDMSRYPIITRVVDACNELAAFEEAAPENQPDAA